MVSAELIRTAIVDQEQELSRKFAEETIIEREAAKQIQLTTDAALIITGIRRCGKSILANMLAKKEKSVYINFDDERLAMNASELNKLLETVYSLKGNVRLLIFDEIQNITGWERFVARLVPTNKVVITGSNSRLLSKELATYLTGRHRDIALFPFSFREFCSWKSFIFTDSTQHIAQAKQYFKEYLEKGGFPLAHKLGTNMLVETFKDVLERDIVQRYNIRNVHVLKDLAKYLISQSSNEFSYNKLKRMFDVKSVHTIKKYISYLETAYLVLQVARFSYKLKEQVLAPKKIYCVDTGLLRALSFSSSDNTGRILENSIALDLWRRGKEFYYWKDHQQHEIDFVVKNGTKVTQLIQVCADISNIGTKERERNALVRGSRELKCKNVLVITAEEDAEENYKGVTVLYVPAWKWLLKGTE